MDSENTHTSVSWKGAESQGRLQRKSIEHFQEHSCNASTTERIVDK